MGYSREQYERTKALPEGSYRISFTAYDYRRQDVQVSNEGSSFYYLSKNEPPLINLPVCGAKVPVRQPQQVIFSWLSRNTSSPASAGETRYEFSLYEIRPEGRNPNDVVLSSQPVFKTTIDYTQLVYGPAKPQLIENMHYAWRVRAIDTQGRDAFRNNDYSEVCTFTYSGVDPALIVGAIEGLQAEEESERSARIWWEKGVSTATASTTKNQTRGMNGLPATCWQKTWNLDSINWGDNGIYLAIKSKNIEIEVGSLDFYLLK